jgi:NADH-quinone oxidoreductase subunit H
MTGILDTNIWVAVVVKVALVLAVMLPGALVVIFGELKISAHMQSRIGPYFAGGRWGWAQPLADGLKFMQKEDLVPAAADARVYRLAPYIVLMGTLATFVIIPFGPDLVPENLDLGIFYLLAVSSLSTLGVLMAGWSSGNKYSLIGGSRAAAQLIAYELPLVLAVVGVAIQAGTLSLNGIVDAQGSWAWFGLEGGWVEVLNLVPPYLVLQFIGFAVFVTAALAELSRIPFDMPIAESELTMGYLTEYSGLRFTMFFLGEYAGMVSLAAVASTLFLGGYWLPFVSEDVLNFLGPIVLLTKVLLLSFVFIWMRWTFPRLREDQLQTIAWKWLIPAALVNIVLTATFKVLSEVVW